MLYTNVKKCDIIIVYYEKQHKGDYIMSKVKQYYTNEAEKSADSIIDDYAKNLINLETAKNKLLKVENVNLVDIDENNVDEVLIFAKEDYWKKANAAGRSQ